MMLNGSIEALQPDPAARAERVRRLTRWSWWMVPMAVGSFLAAFAIGTYLMSVQGVAEGGLLSAAGLSGWLAALLVTAIAVAPLVVGVVLGVRAVRLETGRRTWLPLGVNSVLLTWLLVTSLAQLAFG